MDERIHPPLTPAAKPQKELEMSKKHLYTVGELFRLPETSPAPYLPDTRFRVTKVVNKGKVEAVPHAKEKGKPTFTASVKEMIWCPPITREKYRATKKAKKASTALTVTTPEPEVTAEIPQTETAILES